jgi:hypothetical protein
MKVLRHTNGNIGGINPVQYVFLEDVSVFNINGTTFNATIVLKAGRTWNYLYGSPESIQIEGKEEETPAGMKYSYQMKMLIPKDRVDVAATLHNLNNRHLIINARDKNGVSRYFGTLQCPMKKTGKLLKPAVVEGYNGWEIMFSGDFSFPAAYCASSDTQMILPDE